MSKQAHVKPSKNSSGDWHVSHTSMGMGDYYGTGLKAKIGKMRGDSMGMNSLGPIKLKTPPRSVV